jgi:hypothetical protein
MSSSVERHVLGRIRAASIEMNPFPHCVVDRVFPEDFYEDLLENWPDDESFTAITDIGRVKGGSSARRVIVITDKGLAQIEGRRRRFWTQSVAHWLMASGLVLAATEKFAHALTEFGADPRSAPLGADGLIVSDRTSYAIGPHTDSPQRVVSLLFYVPEDDTFRRFGTSLYVPRDPSFRCPGGPHHEVERFLRAKTIEFLPNRLVMFPKSDRCFHGVEPVDLPGIERRLLIYDVQRLRAG